MAEIRINVVGNSSKKVQEIAAEIRKLEALQKKKFIGDKARSEKINRSLDIQRERLRKLQQGYTQVGNTAQAAGTKVAAGMARANKSISLTTRLITSLRTTMITTFGVFGAIRFVGSSIKTIVSFEKAMANVKAITGATSEEFEKLARLAVEISSEGIFSAKEIADLEVRLAKLGFTITEIADMAGSIVDLATATGENLGTAAELTASTIRGLGLSSVETRKVVDQLGKSFVSSGLDINKYRESIKFIAPIAKDMGIELDAIVAILGQLADRQIFGSLAGTAFRRILIRLADSSSKLSKAVGFTVNSGEDLIQAFITLKERGTTFEELLQLVDVRSLTAASALIDVADSTRDFRDELSNANGEIKDMAEIQLSTLAAATENLQRKWEAMLITVSGTDAEESNFSKTLAALINTGASVIDAFTQVFSLGRKINDNTKEQLELEEDRLIIAKESRAISLLNKEDLDERLDLLQEEIDELEMIVAVKQLATDEDLRRLQIAKELLEKAKETRREYSTDTITSLKTLTNDLKLLREEQSNVNIEAKDGLTIFNLYETEIQALEERIAKLTGKFKDQTDTLKPLKAELSDINKQLRDALILGDTDRIFELTQAITNIGNFKDEINDFTKALIDNQAQFDEVIKDIQDTPIAKRDKFSKILKDQIKNQADAIKEEQQIIEERKRAFRDLAREIGVSATQIADSLVESADRRVDAINNAINETQSALQIELDLNKQGFASNVKLKQEELDKLKILREQALEDQKKALAVQRTIESATQAINLATAVSNVIKSLTGTLGFLGILASVGAGASLFAVFESLKKQAAEVTTFEKGGWRELGGQRHSQGGVNLGAMGEAEKGEVVSVFNRGAVRKHKGLITNFTDMVNSGNFNMQHDVIGDIGRDAVMVNSTVSLDDSSEIQEMNSLMKKNLKQKDIKLFGKDRIVTIGTQTRIIRG